MGRHGRQTTQINPWVVLNGFGVIISFVVDIAGLITLSSVDYTDPQRTMAQAFFFLFLTIYLSIGLLAWLRSRVQLTFSRRSQETLVMLIGWPLLTWWELKFFFYPFGIGLPQPYQEPYQVVALIVALISAAQPGRFLFRKIVIPLATSLAGWLSLPYEIEIEKYPERTVVCFRILMQPDWQRQKTRMDVFNRALETVLHRHDDWARTDWTCMQTESEWIVVGIKLSAEELFDLARETVRMYRSFLISDVSPEDNHRLDIGIGLEYGHIFLTNYLITDSNAMPSGSGVYCARRLAEIAEQGTLLVTKDL